MSCIQTYCFNIPFNQKITRKGWFFGQPSRAYAGHISLLQPLAARAWSKMFSKTFCSVGGSVVTAKAVAGNVTTSQLFLNVTLITLRRLKSRAVRVTVSISLSVHCGLRSLVCGVISMVRLSTNQHTAHIRLSTVYPT